MACRRQRSNAPPPLTAPRPVPTKRAIVQLLEDGAGYVEIAERLGIPLGRAYLIATGLPADGSDSLAPEDGKSRRGVLTSGAQELVNPPLGRTSEPGAALNFLRQRVASDAAMQQAGLEHEATVPEPHLPQDHEHAEEERYDVLDLLGREHVEVRNLLDQLEALPTATDPAASEQDHSRRESILDMITMALSAHEAAEEGHFWPAVRAWLPVDGPAVVEQATSQEEAAIELLGELEGVRASDPRFDELTGELSRLLRAHIALEDDIFDALVPITDVAARVDVGRAISAAERHGPTRPHHSTGAAPARPLLTTALSDHLRDAVGSRPAQRRGRPAQAEGPAE